MGLDDVFSFNTAAYQMKISQLSDIALKQCEVQKARKLLTCPVSIGVGLGGASVTGGLSLVLSAYSARQLRVAYRKLGILHAELTRRSIPLHQLNSNDRAIAVTSGLVAMGVGVGLDVAFPDLAGAEAVDHGTNGMACSYSFHLDDQLICLGRR
jgi:hypothetical protein